jgi:hypothetical protein
VKRRTIIPLAVAAILAAGSALLPSMVGLAHAQTQNVEGGTGIGGIGGDATGGRGGDQVGGDNSINLFTGGAGDATDNTATGGAASQNNGNGGSATLDWTVQMPAIDPPANKTRD